MRVQTRRLLLAAALGALIGLLPPIASAAQVLRLDVLPPAGTTGQNAPLTTGWHHYGNYDMALDWGGGLGPDVYFRSYSYDPASSTITQRIDALVYDTPWGNCQNATEVRLNGLNYVGTMWYVHTDTHTVSSFSIPFNAAGIYTNTKVATMSSGDTCKWFGVHTHMVYGLNTGPSVSLTRNTALYPAAPNNDYTVYPCSGQPCYYQNNSKSNWPYRWDF